MSEKIICEYCGQISTSDPCQHCGANGSKLPHPQKEVRWHPYFYNGYMVWPSSVDDFESILRYYFYLGDTLVDKIQFPRNFIYRIEGHDDFSFDMRRFVWKLFQISQGEEEVLRMEEKVQQNTRVLPATFEIRRIEPEKLTEEEAEQYWIERYQ